MTIQDAIKSQMEFWRPRKGCKFQKHKNTLWRKPNEGNRSFEDGINVLSLEDILADDWEIEEEKIEITRTQFFKAFEGLRLDQPSDRAQESVLAEIAYRLGFTNG